MAAHPHHFTIPGFCIPPPPAEADVALEPRPEAEGQADPPPEEPTFLVEIDYAGNFIARPVAPLTLRPAAPTETPSVLSRDPEPEQWPRPPTPAYPPLGPMLDPHPNEPRPDDLRRVAPPGPRRARGGPPPLGPRSAARGMDPLAPEFTRNLVSKTARIMAGMDRVMRPGGIATPEGLSAAVRAGMQHLAAHQGDVTASIASVKAAGTASHKPDQTPPRHGSVLEGTKPAAATATVVTPVQASGAVETKFRASGLVEYHSHADRDITHTTDSVGDHSIGATLGGWIGGALGTEAGATIGAAAGSVIGPEGTFVGGIAGGRIGGRIGSKGGAALGSVIEKAIIIAVSGSDSQDEKPRKPLRRPYVRKGIRQAAEAAAKRDESGRPIDPNTGEPIDGKPDLGHKPKHENRNEIKKAEKEGLTQKEFNERMNDPDIYQLEDPSSNRSRKFEEK